MENKVIIGKPYLSSKLLSREILECYEVQMTCGGGMGGSFWKEYLTTDIPLGNATTQEFTSIYGETKRINTHYCVSSEKVRIVHEVWDILKNKTYHDKTQYKSYTRNIWHCVALDKKIVFSDVAETDKSVIRELDESEEI